MPNPSLMPNWVIMVMPFMEEKGLLATFNLKAFITDPSNAISHGTQIAEMLCPTDYYNVVPFDGTQYGLGSNWARGNYAANGTLDYMDDGNVGPTAAGWVNSYYRGVMGANVSCSLRDITDGTSKTILVGEIRAGLIPADARGIWAMGGGCASALYAHGWMGDDGGPDNDTIAADDVFSCDVVANALGGAAALQLLGMPCYTGDAGSHQQTIRSLHVFGAQVVFCDGSVHFISDDIAVGNSSTNLGVWDMLNLSQDGYTFQDGSY